MRTILKGLCFCAVIASPILSKAQHEGIAFVLEPASTNHIYKPNADTKSTFGGYYAIEMTVIKKCFSYGGGIGLSFSGADFSTTKASVKQIIAPIQFGIFPNTTGVKPIAKLSIIPGLAFDPDLDGLEQSMAGELYSENLHKLNVSLEGIGGVRFPLKEMGLIEVGAGYLRTVTSIQKHNSEYPYMIVGHLSIIALIK